MLFGKIHAQNTETANFIEQIKNYDLSTILTAEHFLAEDRENSKDKIKRAEILGFIGDDYQRFFIHFISVIQNPTNPYEYLVYGKTMVKNNVCSFQGMITIREARIYKSGDIATYKQGFATCDVTLFEDKKQSSTGLLKGKLTSNFIIDHKNRFRYDALMYVADGFSNNQFVGHWTSYKTNTSKKCNWGDYRVPECGDLDIGAGEFSVNEKYVRNGWLSYMLENMAPNGAIIKPTTGEKAKDTKWWE
ncbi:hypothetical protein DBR11_05660 [Pedobacter sp. HMWF019]|nr:hypothetical protein DBR11_05660 [Pedobacter sp. HMWF019]